MRFLRILCLCGLMLFSGMVTAKQETPQTITIGLVDTFSPEFYIKSYSPTLDYLIENLKQYKFNIVEIDYRKIQEDIRQFKPDFLVTSASDYVSLLDESGAQQVATKKPKTSPTASQTVASLFIVNAESSYASLKDTKGARIAISDENSFDGWLIAQGAIFSLGKNPERFFSEIIQTHYGIPSVTSLVKLKKADVGVLSTCEYERLLQSGAIKRGEFRLLNEKPSINGCARSTDLFPDVVFSSLPQVPEQIVKDVTVALLSMPDDNLDFQWMVANDFRPTFDLLKALQKGPFKEQPLTFKRIWMEYRTEGILALILFAAILFHIFSVNILVQKRTRQLSISLEDTKRFYQEAQESKQKLLSLERMNIVSELSSMFAHEIKQPITNIGYYAGAIKIILKRSKQYDAKLEGLLESIAEEVQRSSDIVEHVRSYAKKHTRSLESCNLNEIVNKALAASQHPEICHFEDDRPHWVRADSFELYFIVSNFLKNAISAVSGVTEPKVSVEISEVGDDWKLTVRDNGPAISQQQFEGLGKVGPSSKQDGLGFGLAIATAMAEGNGGHLEFERNYPTGLAVSLVMEKEKHNE